MGTNEIDFASLAAEPTAIYLALDPQYSRTLAPLTACFFLHFFTTLTNIAKTAPSGALPVSVLAYLDELRTMRDEVFVVAGHHHPVRARQRRYYDDPTLARLVPDPAGTDPLLALRRVVPLPIPMLTSQPVSRDNGEEGLRLEYKKTPRWRIHCI